MLNPLLEELSKFEKKIYIYIFTIATHESYAESLFSNS